MSEDGAGDFLPSGEEEFRPRRFLKRLARRHRGMLIVIMLSMGAWSCFQVLQLGALGLIGEVAVHILRQKEAPDPQKVEKGNILLRFEASWQRIFDAEPPTARLHVPERFYRFWIWFTVAAVAACLAMGGFFFLKELLAQSLVLKVITEMRQAIVDHLLHQSLSFFHRQKAGDLLSRVSNDVVSLNTTLRVLFETLVQEPIAIIASLTAAFVASWRLSLMVIPCYLLLFIPIFRSGRKVKRYGRKSLEKLGEVTEDLSQLFSGMRTVKAFGMEDHERRDFGEKNRGYVRKTLRMARAKITGRTFQEIGYNTGVAVFIFLMGWLLYSGRTQMSSGQFVMFIGALFQIYHPVKSITRALNQLQESKGGYERILELLRSRPQVVDAPGAQEFPGLKQEVRFDAVGFSYNGEEPQAGKVLHGVSLTVKAGQVAAIVGPSGAGKSTLVDLLARFHDPHEGAILVDGVDIRRFRHASYLKGVAIVSQDPFLFNATIEENIAYGREGATREEIEEAARRAHAHEFILEQPQGYQTRIGERGVMLSGGQRQRITIARAILKDAPILILDEATSALDSGAEKEVQRALENLMRDRTTFVIAHRLSTIVHADTILVLDEGRLVEEGTHEDLLGRKGRYWKLHLLQTTAA